MPDGSYEVLWLIQFHDISPLFLWGKPAARMTQKSWEEAPFKSSGCLSVKRLPLRHKPLHTITCMENIWVTKSPLSAFSSSDWRVPGLSAFPHTGVAPGKKEHVISLPYRIYSIQATAKRSKKLKNKTPNLYVTSSAAKVGKIKAWWDLEVEQGKGWETKKPLAIRLL